MNAAPTLPPVRWSSRLVVQIYVLGLAQFALVMLVMFIILTQTGHPPLPITNTLAFVTDTLAAEGDDPAGLAKIIARVRHSLGCSAAVYDDTGHLVAHDPLATAPPLLADVRQVDPGGEAPISLANGKRYRLVFLAPTPISKPPVFWPWLTVIIVGVGAFALLVGQSLARPLARLSDTARRFGSGQLEARVGMIRSDELGRVATAFDWMADRVAHALRVEKELLVNISHELRTPLQRIHIAVELAGEGDAGTARESLAEIAEDLGELERIVEDVLTATRLSLSEGSVFTDTPAAPPMRPEPIELGALLDRSATRFRAAHPERPLRVTLAEDLPVVNVDAVLVRRVVDNLLDNANKYSEDTGSEIALTAHKEPGKVTIEVRDRGIGISTTDLARLFQPFFRAERSRTQATGGLGLGLALARRIVESHGGRLTIESVVDVGTCARVELPLGDPRQPRR